MSSIMNLIRIERQELFNLQLGEKKTKQKKKNPPIVDFAFSLASANIHQSAPKMVKIYMTYRSRMRMIEGPIASEQPELFSLDLGKKCLFDFVYTVASTNIKHSSINKYNPCLHCSIYKYQTLQHQQI